MDTNTLSPRDKLNTTLDLLPDYNIDNVLSYAEDLLLLNQQNPDIAKNLAKIMKRDDNLLKRLAK